MPDLLAEQPVSKMPKAETPKATGDKAPPAYWADRKGLNAYRGAMGAKGIKPDDLITEREFDDAYNKWANEPCVAKQIVSPADSKKSGGER